MVDLGEGKRYHNLQDAIITFVSVAGDVEKILYQGTQSKI